MSDFHQYLLINPIYTTQHLFLTATLLEIHTVDDRPVLDERTRSIDRSELLELIETGAYVTLCERYQDDKNDVRYKFFHDHNPHIVVIGQKPFIKVVDDNKSQDNLGDYDSAEQSG